MWQSYTTWISGVLLLISVFYVNGGQVLLDTTKTTLPGWGAIGLSVAGILGWWLLYDTLWRTKLKESPKTAIPLTLILLFTAAWFYHQYFNGRAVYLQIGAMMGSAMSANVFFHIIRNQKKFMKSLSAGLPHDMKYGKQAKLRSMHNHYMTFPVLFMMLSAHFPQLTSAGRCVPVLGIIIVALMAVNYLMNSRYFFRHWLAAIFWTFILVCGLIGLLITLPEAKAARTGQAPAPGGEEGKKLFVSQGCAAYHLAGGSAIAPDLKGLFGSTQILTDDSKIVADDAYLHESIRQPQLKIVKGYAAAMPVLPLSDEQVDRLVAYLKSL